MQQIKFKRGFTLVELLLAIFLVGLFAYFIFATPSEYKEPKVEVNATNLPSFLQKNLNGDGEVVCINNCKECYYITNSAKAINAPIPMKLSVKNEYILDRNDNPIKLDLGRYKDKKVCMRFRHYKNGSISQIILDLGDKALFIPSYFGEGKEFNSVSSASDWWIRDSQNRLKSRGDWY
jgi:prepilin-type N-terminal cleavage/methylation domain-containing protein